MFDVTELLELQKTIGVPEEEIARRAKMSKTTLRRALKGQAPERTLDGVVRALESLRRERIEKLSGLGQAVS